MRSARLLAALLLSAPTPSLAQVQPMSGDGDPHLQLVDYNQGQIVNAYGTGAVSNNLFEPTGGLVAYNTGTIDGCYAAVNVAAAGDADMGGLVGDNWGQIATSFATGKISSGDTDSARVVGGLVGDFEDGTIKDSYATGAVTAAFEKHAGDSYFAGGLIGFEDDYMGYSPNANTSYSTGTVPKNGHHRYSGGSVGFVSRSATNTDLYWDTTTSGTSVGVGAGSSNGVTGLTTQQLQSGLPSGFDPKVWADAAPASMDRSASCFTNLGMHPPWARPPNSCERPGSKESLDVLLTR